MRTYFSPFHAISFSNRGKNCKEIINIRQSCMTAIVLIVSNRPVRQ